MVDSVKARSGSLCVIPVAGQCAPRSVRIATACDATRVTLAKILAEIQRRLSLNEPVRTCQRRDCSPSAWRIPERHSVRCVRRSSKLAGSRGQRCTFYSEFADASQQSHSLRGATDCGVAASPVPDRSLLPSTDVTGLIVRQCRLTSRRIRQGRIRRRG